jgi:nucleoid-associated protein YgaU
VFRACKPRLVLLELSGLALSFGVMALVPAAAAYSQSLGEIARQEQERRRAQPSPPTHVYDNDDLARPHILLPEDKERFQAAKKKAEPATVETPAETAENKPKVELPVQPSVPQEPETRTTVLVKPVSRPMPQKLQPPTRVSEETAVSRAAAPRTAAPLPTRMVRAQVEIPTQRVRARGVSRTATIRILPGDTLWKIASKYLRGGKDWMLLAAYNPQVRDVMRLPVGMSVLLPEEALRFRSPKEIIVQRGDSLWKLARDQLGNGKQWGCLLEENPGIKESGLIFAGQTLTIPAACESPPFARARRQRDSGQLSASSAGSPARATPQLATEAPFR